MSLGINFFFIFNKKYHDIYLLLNIKRKHLLSLTYYEYEAATCRK